MNQSAETRTIPAKLHVVYDPQGNRHYVYASTKAGAINAVKNSQAKKPETWNAKVATVAQATEAGRIGATIINDPNPPADTAAPNGVGGEPLVVDHTQDQYEAQ